MSVFNQRRGVFYVFFLLVFVLLASPEMSSYAVGAAQEETTDQAYEEIERLTEVLLHIRKHYVEEQTYESIISGALQGMLQSLDPHSCFLEPDAFHDIQHETAGKFSGIGIHIGLKAGILTIIAPIEDTPGFRAGLQSGDRIVEIDGEKTQGITLRDAVKKLRGPKGTRVTLKIHRLHEDELREVEIIRDDIEVPSVKGDRIISDGIGYVRITQFAEPTACYLQEALDKLTKAGMDALVLDLRSNPGGLLRSAIEVSQKFLKKGKLIVTTKGRKGVHDPVAEKAYGDYHCVDLPMAVLVNGGTASASEIVAGALQDHKRAVIIGDTTFGKGSVQSVIRLKYDVESAIRLTIAYYYTPNGRKIHEKGIEPDIRVCVSPKEWQRIQAWRAQIESPDHFSAEDKERYQDVIDYQLQRAIDLLKAVKIFKK